MKKIITIILLSLLTVSAQAKEKLGIVFAGSLGGSFNKFNSALSKDLSKWYDIEEISTGGSSTKGGTIFTSIDDRAIFMMNETAKRNVILDSCQDYVSYSCGVNPDDEIPHILIFVCLVSASILISGTIIYLCAKSMLKNQTRTEYTYIGNEDL